MPKPMKPMFDKSEWVPCVPLPKWIEEKDRCPKSGHRKIDPEASAYIISRARYSGIFNRDIDADRLAYLYLADEMLRESSPGTALAIFHNAYPRNILHFDECFKEPSDDARAIATFLYAYLIRLRDYKIETGRELSPAEVSQIALIKTFVVWGDEKRALAQELILRFPRKSQGSIAGESRNFPCKKFDQSVLSQWIKAGIVVDPHRATRPKFQPGRSPSGAPE